MRYITHLLSELLMFNPVQSHYVFKVNLIVNYQNTSNKTIQTNRD